jgi:death on curing protein
VSEPVWIDEREALAIHDQLLSLDGGASGVRDEGLLASALARPRQIDPYGDDLDIVDMAAAYTAGIVRNHPFVDGNKRTGLILGALFLELNGYNFTASEEAAAQAVMALAAGTLDEAAFSAWVRANAKRQ